MTSILHRAPKLTLPVAVSGDGPYVIDQAGKRYLDASGGAAVSCLGHSNKKVVEAIKDQLDKLPYAHSGFFTNQPSEELAEFLVREAPGDLKRVYFLSGGSEANETALKLARQYFVEKGEPQRRHFIARHQSYHGNTLGVLAIGGNPGRRALYEPIMMPGHYISPPYAYRHQQAEESLEAYGQRIANELEDKILELGPESVIGFVAETVGGATGGALVPPPGYLKRIREICDRHGILLILDEVMSGMGRTGYRYACNEDGVVPDLLTCAKGLGAGYQPIGACLLSEDIYQTILQGSGAFQHGFTYIGHPSACAGALAVQRVIDEEGLLDNVHKQGAALRSALEERFGQHAHVGDIRGRGLFLALELVKDRESKAAFDPALKLNARLKQEAMAQGLMCYPGGGTVDGAQGDHVLLAPPFIINDSQVEEIVDKLSAALERTLAQAG
ncbi:aspartate aminotransferase family protein [Rhodovibrionaceae bacterium A322]